MEVLSVILVILGIVLCIVNVWMEKPESPADAARRLPGEEIGSPGPRGERSDEYVGGGGAGGAEGEIVPPAFQAPADGGIGGAEGGEAAGEASGRTGPLGALGGMAIAGGTIGFLLVSFYPDVGKLTFALCILLPAALGLVFLLARKRAR